MRLHRIPLIALLLATAAIPAHAQPGTGPISGGGGGGGGEATSVQGSATLPATCTEKDIYQDTNSGGTELYICTATNTWTKVGTIGGTLTGTDDLAVCTDGTGGSTIGACTVAAFPTGSAAAPSITLGDATTGFYRAGANQFGFAAGGSQKLQIDLNALIIMSGYSLLGQNGGAYSQGFLLWREGSSGTSGTPKVWLYSEVGKLIDNTGVAAKNYNTLFDAAAGRSIGFCNLDADGMRITAATGDTIRRVASVTTSGGYIETTTVGACVELVAMNATEWLIWSTNDVGTDSWTFN